ncbi:CHAD domain-containing protein, partial [Pseudomonas frederiksbergensis]|nr:CHAD domain-containing protein [Pseudomonas frederiksbergensis]
MAFVGQYVAEFISLEVKLLNARERLRASTDDEALHDLRIAVRRIRSLLIPVRRLEGVERLKLAATKVGRVTTPVRDLEVMAGELDS